MCHHMTSCCSTQGTGGVQYGGPRRISKEGEIIGAEAKFKAVRGFTLGDPDGCPCLNRTPLAAGDKEGCMTDSVAI